MARKLTAGERAVWAAEFVRVMEQHSPDAGRWVDEAARRATLLVLALRQAASMKSGDEVMRSMLHDMAGDK